MDDVTVLINRVLERTEWFGEASGAKLNRKKTVLKLYGQWGELERRELPLKEEKGEMKVLEVEFDSEGLGGSNWDNILKNIERKGQFWQLRQLAIEGKILIIKAVLVPMLLFVRVAFVPSQSVLARLDRIVFRFIWGGGHGSESGGSG